jgi:hypothetical protein
LAVAEPFKAAGASVKAVQLKIGHGECSASDPNYKEEICVLSRCLPAEEVPGLLPKTVANGRKIAKLLLNKPTVQ